MLLRGAEEAHQISLPTTVSGTNTDGQLTGVDFRTPTIEIVQDVPQYGTQAFIDAVFSMTEPGTGTINENGDVTVRLSVTVDLHIVVPILANPYDCRATPIQLDLISVAPYDGERVTLEAANFTIPQVPDVMPCMNLIAQAVNEALAGAGHRLTMTFTGAVTPPVSGEPTATELAVSPADGARVGQDVTLTAMVAPDPAVPGAPELTGTVTFYDGATVLGTVDLDEAGEAVLVTDVLPAGPRSLRAAYSGAPPDWQPSSSEVAAYAMAAPALASTDLGGEVQVGTPGRDFAVTVTNTGLGQAMEGVRLEVLVEATGGTLVSAPASLVLSRVAGGTVTPVPLVASGRNRIGIVGDAATWSVAPGAERTETMRIEAPTGTPHGPLRITFALVVEEDGEDVVLSSAVAEVLVHTGARIPTTLTAGTPAIPGFPPFFPDVPEYPPVTAVVRQGNVAEVVALDIGPVVDRLRPGGTVRFLLAGRAVPARLGVTGGSVPWAEAVSYRGIVEHFHLRLPADAPTGVQQVTVLYSGDGLYEPAQVSWPLTVEPRIGAVYDCQRQGFSSGGRFTANIEVSATLPTLGVAGSVVDLDRVAVRLRATRTQFGVTTLNAVLHPISTDRVYEARLSAGGVVEMATVAQTGNTPMVVGELDPVDWTIELGGGRGTLPIEHGPGESLDVVLDTVTVTAVNNGVPDGFMCLPVQEPQMVGSVTAVGTSLSVEPGGVVRQRAPVALTAEARPAGPGVVEFRDGTTTVGVVPVDAQGRASVTVDGLPVGPRSLTARFFSSSAVPSTTSAPVEVVVEATACEPFAEAGQGATVRLVYLELLGRCPDQAGFDHWVAQLEGGVAPAAFARAIARTPEAVGRVVDDAYRTMLDRPADTAGRVFWTGQLQRHGRYDRLLADLGASGEFGTKAGGTDAGFVTRVYDRLLGRSPDAAGLSYWTGRLAAGTSPRTLIESLANLDEPLGVLVAGSYEAILDRAPDTGERSSGIAHLRATGDRSGLYAQLIGRPEFFTRAQAFPNP